MSEKHKYQIKKWQCLIKEYQNSGMKLKDWCAANAVTKDQYYYWLRKIRSEGYEAAVKQLKRYETGVNGSIPLRVANGSFVEIGTEIVRGTLEQNNLNQPAAIVQKGSIRIEIMESASASFIRQLLEAVQYA